MDLKNIESLPRITFNVEGPLVSHFFLLLQRGVTISARFGCSVMAFLKKEMGLSPETIEKIQTIFLDGSAVDNMESALVKDGSSLALSAAMPGLVGATLRRGGTYSSLRSGITYHETAEHCASGEGLVRIKLFNLLMAELGPGLLRKGVIIESEDFVRFAAGQSKEFWVGCREILIDGKPLNGGELQDRIRPLGQGRVILSVSSNKN